jgi:hypothetical protein
VVVGCKFAKHCFVVFCFVMLCFTVLNKGRGFTVVTVYKYPTMKLELVMLMIAGRGGFRRLVYKGVSNSPIWKQVSGAG